MRLHGLLLQLMISVLCVMLYTHVETKLLSESSVNSISAWPIFFTTNLSVLYLAILFGPTQNHRI